MSPPTLERLLLPLRQRLHLQRAQLLWWGPQGVWEIGATDATSNATATAEAFDAWCAAHRGQCCGLLVSSAWLHTVDSVELAGAQRDRDIQDQAQAQLLQYHGDDALAWPLLPWRDGPHSGASACTGPSLQALQTQAAAQGVRLAGVHPGWWWIWQQLKGQGGHAADSMPALWVLDEGPVATVLCVEGGRLRSASVRRSGALTPALLQAWAGQSGVGPQATVQTISVPAFSAGSGPADAPKGTGFLLPTGNAALRWLAAAAALLMAMLAALDAAQAWQARAQAVAQAGTSTADLRQAPAGGTAPEGMAARPAPGPQTPANIWQSSLAQPWSRVFSAAEYASQGSVQWLALSHQGQHLRLAALAPHVANVQSAAAALQSQPGVASVLVERIETRESGVRFDLQVQWAAARPGSNGSGTVAALGPSMASPR